MNGPLQRHPSRPIISTDVQFPYYSKSGHHGSQKGRTAAAMLITRTAPGTAMIDAPLDGAVGPGDIAVGDVATGAGEGAFFGGDFAARVNEQTSMHQVEITHHRLYQFSSYTILYTEWKLKMRLYLPGGGVGGVGGAGTG